MIFVMNNDLYLLIVMVWFLCVLGSIGWGVGKFCNWLLRGAK